MLTRREWLAGSAALSPAILRGTGKKINVVFIMTDDHGAWALNSYGCRDIHSPNIDRLGSDGARFFLATGGESKNDGTPLGQTIDRLPGGIPALPVAGEK